MSWFRSLFLARGLSLWALIRAKEATDSMTQISREDPEELLSGSELSESDRHAAVGREAERREEEER